MQKSKLVYVSGERVLKQMVEVKVRLSQVILSLNDMASLANTKNVFRRISTFHILLF